MSVKFCGKCGAQLKEGAKFCPKCGWKVPLVQEKKVEIFKEPEEKEETQNLESEIPKEKESTQDLENKELQKSKEQFSPSKQEEQVQTPIQRENIPPVGIPPKRVSPDRIPSEKVPINQTPPGRIPPNQMQSPPPREFNPYGKSANVKGSFYGEQNKKAGRKTGIIVTIVLASIVIVVMIILLIMTLKGRSNPDNFESSNNTFEGEQVIGENQESQGVEGISGEWDFETIIENVNGEDAESYKDIIGETSFSSLTIDEDTQQISILEEMSGIEIPMSFEKNGNKIVFGYTVEENSAEYTGKLSKTKDGQIIEGSWESVTKNEGQDIQMQGVFRAEKYNPAIPKDIIAKAVSATAEELEGTYEGTLIYTEMDNLDKAPSEDMPPEEVEMLLSLKDQPLDCKVLVESGYVEVYASAPDLGEGEIAGDIEIENFQEGVFQDTIIEAGREGESAKKATMIREMVILDKDGTKGIFGIIRMKALLTNGEEMSIKIEFDTRYKGPIEE